MYDGMCSAHIIHIFISLSIYKTTVIAKLVSIEWKGLNKEERARWEKMARLDKERFEREKSTYNGPWQVPVPEKNAFTPKRPMSGFLDFSNQKRKLVQFSNPHLKGKYISKILGNMWKEASAEERAFFMDRERELLQTYKSKMKAWKERAHHTAVGADTDTPFHPHHHEEHPPFHQNDTALVESPGLCRLEADDVYLNIPSNAGTSSMNWEPRAVFREDFYHENESIGTFETTHSSSNHPGSGELHYDYVIQAGSIFVDNPHDQRTTIPGHTMTMNNTQPDGLFYRTTPQLGSIKEPYVLDKGGLYTLADSPTQPSTSTSTESEDNTDQLFQEIVMMLSRS
jgi:hypothetical protein